MKLVRFHSEATEELSQAIAYYEQQKIGLGLDLLAAVEQAVQRIRQNPEWGAPYKDTVFRHVKTHRFPFVIFYVEWENSLWIVAVAHAKRRPDYWRRRRPN